MPTTAHFEISPAGRSALHSAGKSFRSYLNTANIVGTGCIMSGVLKSWDTDVITPAGAALHIAIVLSGVALHAMEHHSRVSLAQNGASASGQRTGN
jgi:hypothetical protein